MQGEEVKRSTTTEIHTQENEFIIPTNAKQIADGKQLKDFTAD